MTSTGIVLIMIVTGRSFFKLAKRHKKKKWKNMVNAMFFSGVTAIVFLLVAEISHFLLDTATGVSYEEHYEYKTYMLSTRTLLQVAALFITIMCCIWRYYQLNRKWSKSLVKSVQ